MRVLAERWKAPEHLAFGPGTLLAVAYSSGLVVWDAATGEQVARFRYSSAPLMPVAAKAVFFPPDGRAVYVADTHQGLCGFGLPDLTPEPTERPDPVYLHAAAMSGDGRGLVCSAVWGGHLGLYTFRREPAGPPTRVRDIRVGDPVLGLGFFPTGDRFAATSHRYGSPRTRQHQVEVRSWPSGEVRAAARHDRSEVEEVAVSPDGFRVVVRAGMTILAWPASLDGDPVRAANDNRRHFTGVAFHPSGRFLAATANDATVKLYDPATLALVRTFTWGVGRLRSVAFSADGTLAAAAGEAGRVVVWDVDL